MKRSWAGELGREAVGREVLLKGWVQRRRDHGGVVFLDLRDRSGVVQVVLHQSEVLDAAAVVYLASSADLGKGPCRAVPEGLQERHARQRQRVDKRCLGRDVRLGLGQGLGHIAQLTLKPVRAIPRQTKRLRRTPEE